MIDVTIIAEIEKRLPFYRYLFLRYDAPSGGQFTGLVIVDAESLPYRQGDPMWSALMDNARAVIWRTFIDAGGGAIGGMDDAKALLCGNLSLTDSGPPYMAVETLTLGHFDPIELPDQPGERVEAGLLAVRPAPII